MILVWRQMIVLMIVQTCYKNPNKSSRIDIILTNKLQSFQHSCVIEAGLSDFYKMTITVMKATFGI